MAEKIGVTTRTVEREIKKLREAGKITRTGGKRYGYWKVREQYVLIHGENTWLTLKVE